MTRIVRISLVVELAAWVAIAAWLHRTSGVRWEVLAVGTIVGVVAVRLALVALTCTLGWLFRSERAPAQRLGSIGALRLVFDELRALLADNFWAIPFDSLALRPDPPPATATQLPVVMVHGYLANRGYWAPMVRWLEARGVGPIYVPSYRSIFSTIEQGAAELHAAVEAACAGGAPRVVLVCHSMGGLLARTYLQEHGDGRVARLVTIATPHHGTVLSRLGIGEHARQMCRGSDFLTALARAETAEPPRVPTTSIYTVHDNLVSPQDTSRLDWARNVAIAGMGHVAIVASERAFALVLEELRAAEAAA
jgi:pimeloyl-ACP methyl ester carboxylesterase